MDPGGDQTGEIENSKDTENDKHSGPSCKPIQIRRHQEVHGGVMFPVYMIHVFKQTNNNDGGDQQIPKDVSYRYSGTALGDVQNND